MDRLRGMEYLVGVVQAGNFSGAARKLGVSPASVTKMISGLEHDLGVPLFVRHENGKPVRSGQGVTLTPEGQQFFPFCVRTLEDLNTAEAECMANNTHARGKLVIGMPKVVGLHCVAPYLPQFLARHPGLTLDWRIVDDPKEPLAASVDAMVIIGWLEKADFVTRKISDTRFVTCASPAYWEAHGRPSEPKDLRGHTCLAYRLPYHGTVLADWKYCRNGTEQTVAVEPRVISDDRDWLIEQVIRGVGVARLADFVCGTIFSSGLLEPVLADWEALDAPPIYLLYRRSGRSLARVRAFVRFITLTFTELSNTVRPPHSRTSLPLAAGSS